MEGSTILTSLKKRSDHPAMTGYAVIMVLGEVIHGRLE